MRLIDTATLELVEKDEKTIRGFAILSHRWEEEEVEYQHMSSRELRQSRRGWSKITWLCEYARRWGLQWAWVDTCCIDKSSSAELTEAINSMWRWYANATVCFVYLSDVSIQQSAGINQRTVPFVASEWFRRGWTLQELIAPSKVHFFDRYWKFLGDRVKLSKQIEQATHIRNISGSQDLRKASVAQKMSWASRRRVTRDEDVAYCLMGLFDISMPVLYGEGGEKAFQRLQTEIINGTDDESIFAWDSNGEPSGLLAKSPHAFLNSQNIIRHSRLGYREPPRLTNKGLQIGGFAHVYEEQLDRNNYLNLYQVPLNCKHSQVDGEIPVWLLKIPGETKKACRIGYMKITRQSDVVKKKLRKTDRLLFFLAQYDYKDWFHNFDVPQDARWIDKAVEDYKNGKNPQISRNFEAFKRSILQ